MDKNAALAQLGLTGGEDAGIVTQAYSARLAMVQEKLVSAQTEADRVQSQTQLSQLVEAFELVTQSGRYTSVRGSAQPATAVRTPQELAATWPLPGDTSIRMETGSVLSNRIEIGELLGSGGMGNVYAARDRLKEEDVAIKVLRPDLTFSSAAKERFLAEAKMSCSLSHPNIVRVHDVGVSDDHYYFSMERLRGQTLRQRIVAYHDSARQFSIAEVTDIARQLIDALRYAHRYIVHRDVKPENIWIAEDGTVKLMDFGIARAYTNSQLTQTGMTLGTAYYMAPEQRLTAKDADWRADQYSLGVVLYELLAGSVPMGSLNSNAMIRPGLPPRLSRALMKAMAAKPEDRWPSLDQMLTEMVASPSKAPKAAVVVVLIGALLVAGGAGAVYFGGFKQLFTTQASSAGAQAPTAASNVGKTVGGGDGSGSATQPPAGGPPADTSAAIAAMPVEKSESTPTASPVDAMDTPLPDNEPSAAAAANSQLVNDAPVRTKPSSLTASSATDASDAPTRVAMVDQSPVARCIAQCERDQGECKSIGRRGKQECMRAVGFNANGSRISPSGNRLSNECGFFGHARCQYARHPAACFERMRIRYDACASINGNVASRRQDCDDRAREGEQLCLTELRECRDSCS
jgi:serine/threonine protein kinase